MELHLVLVTLNHYIPTLTIFFTQNFNTGLTNCKMVNNLTLKAFLLFVNLSIINRIYVYQTKGTAIGTKLYVVRGNRVLVYGEI